MHRKKEKKNYLDFIPVWNPAYTWDKDEKGQVVVHVVHKGFYHWIAQKCFRRPRISHIALDRYGSFVWQQMDGKADIYEISGRVRERFGKEAEPVLERLVDFTRILYQNAFIGYRKEALEVYGHGSWT